MSNREDAQSEWLLALLTEMQATIHAEEAGTLPRYEKCQATEAAWWPHIGSISDVTVHGLSVLYESILSRQIRIRRYACEVVRMPLAVVPLSDFAVEAAFAFKKKWTE
ncbi:hypothetical protein E4U19_000345 [Claviceps sp. Clav32 group G5]|nr:hypothetical protein E4U19_000345 [Claviceps sp. Clav32 group G5]